MNDCTENQNPEFQFFRFESLRVYHKALDHVVYINNLLETNSNDANKLFSEKYYDIVLDIPINIADGCCRNKVQFVQILKKVKSLIRESVVMTAIGTKLDFFSEIQEAEIKQNLIELTKMVGALIASILKDKNNSDTDCE